MTGKSASLLTQTQRRRLRNEFEDVDEDAKRRDQQLIRERIRSGVLDFQLLADYPDSQYERAFDDISDETLRAALADTYLAAERIRDLHRYDRDQLLRETRAHAEAVSTEATDVRSLDRLNLHTAAEIRQQTETDLENRFASGRWETRATGALKLAGATFILGFIFLALSTLNEAYTTRGWDELAAVFAIVALLFGGIGGTIIALHAVRYDIIPVGASVVRWGRGIGRTARRRFGADRNWFERTGDRTAWWKRGGGEGTGDASLAIEDHPPMDILRRRYAAGELTDEGFERKRDQLRDPHSLEDADTSQERT